MHKSQHGGHVNARKLLSDVCPIVPFRTASDRPYRDDETLTGEQQEFDRRYQLLVATVDRVIQEGFFSTALRTGDIIPTLRDGAISASSVALAGPDAEIIERAEKVTRHLIYVEKKKLYHPKKLETGDWTAPAESIPCDVFGARLSGPQGVNVCEDSLINQLDRKYRWLRMLETIGPDKARRLESILHQQGAVSNADRKFISRITRQLRHETPFWIALEVEEHGS